MLLEKSGTRSKLGGAKVHLGVLLYICKSSSTCFVAVVAA